MPSITIPKGSSVYLPFVVNGPGGPSDIDTTTVVTAAQVSTLGEVAAQLVTSDGPTTRRLRVDVPPTAGIGPGRGDVAVTARNKTGHQQIDVSAAADFSNVTFGAPGQPFPTPGAGDPQFP